MTTLACLLILLPLYVTASGRLSPMIQPPEPQPRAGKANPDVVAKACEASPEKDICVLVLEHQDISQVNDLKQATFVAILTASAGAVTTSNMIKTVRRKKHNQAVDGIEEVALVNCAMNYVSLVKMLSEANSALMNGPEADVMVGVKAAMTMAETCDKSVVDGRKNPIVDQVLKMNEKVRKFCSVALNVYNVYATQR